jgi:hypothetical protein
MGGCEWRLRDLFQRNTTIFTISHARVLSIQIPFLDPPESIDTILAKIDTSSFTIPFLVKRNSTTQPCMPSCCESDSLSRACVQVLSPDFAIGRKRRSHCRRRQGLQCRCLYLCFGQPKPRELMSSRHLPTRTVKSSLPQSLRRHRNVWVTCTCKHDRYKLSQARIER